MKRAISFVSGLMLALLAVLFSVAVPAMNSARFEKAVLNTVNREAVGMSESDLTAFARETMDYLHGRSDAWQPRTPFDIPKSFVDHMAEVKGWVDGLKIALPAALLAALLCLWLGRNLHAALAGMLTLIGLAAALILWAVIDFSSLWMVIHRVLIPGGIFPAGEPVMQLFPLELFFGYLPPLTGGMVGYNAGLLALLYAKARKSSRD